MSLRKTLIGICGAAALLVTLTACPPVPPDGVVYASEGPPPMRTEVAIAAPGPDFVWVPGYWNWGGSAYVWTAGAWSHPPHVHARWVAPSWHHNGHGWYSTRGEWR